MSPGFSRVNWILVGAGETLQRFFIWDPVSHTLPLNLPYGLLIIDVGAMEK
jgi:hypothetical protein